MAFPPLPDQVKADMFLHFSTMERSGLPPDKAAALLNLPGKFQERVSVYRRLLKGGADIPAAGNKSGLFSDLETNLCRAACHSGSPEPCFNRLATRYAIKARLASQVRSRMTMPLLVLFLALVLQPLPSLVAGTMTGVGFVLSVVRPFIFLAILLYLYRFVVQRLFALTNRPTAIQVTLSTLLIKLPLFGKMIVRKNLRDFFENLALMTESGVPMLDALPKAIDTISVCVIRDDYQKVQRAIEQGMTLHQALSLSNTKETELALGFVQTGEASGTLPEMLFRFADGESQTIVNFQTQMADWLPRIFYAMVAAWMAYQILGSHAFAPPVIPT